MKVIDLAKLIEEKSDVGALFRYSWVVPANKSESKKKEYNWEFPAMTSEDIANPQYQRGKLKIPGRGWATIQDIPSYFKKQNKSLAQAYPALSIYLKFVPDLYVVDFDDMSRCVLKEENVEPDPTDSTDEGKPWNPFYDYCMKSGTLYTRTAKGYHFYFYLPGCPEIKNALKIQSKPLYGDVDILGRKHASSQNVVEACHHEVKNYENGIKSVEFSVVEDFFNVAKMTTDKGDGDKAVVSKLEESENKAICAEGFQLDESRFKSYLSRLRTEDHPTQTELESRYHYNWWMRIGLICKNNFGEDEGFDIWREWTLKDPHLDDDLAHKGRSTHAKMWEKWQTFKDTPGTPITWRSLRNMANRDDPSSNPYEEIYQSGGESALVEYINGFTMFNKKTCEVLYENPYEDKIYDGKPNVYKKGDAQMVFAKWSFYYENPHTGKMQFKNPFDIWFFNVGRRDVNDIVFDPHPSASDSVYNLYRGMAIEAKDVEDMTEEEAYDECACLIDHIKTIWCHGDEEMFNYILNWFAFVIQKPYQKIKVYITVKSKEGAGKGIVFSFMREILGDRLYAQINDLEAITGRFNPILEGRLLINGDEVVWGGEQKKGNKMKNIISEPEIWIEEKNRSIYSIKNTTAFCFSSNEERCMSSKEGCRRGFATELSNKWAGRQTTQEHLDYFNNISGTTNHTIARSKALAFAKILYSRDLTEFVPSNAPITEMLTDNMERNMSPLQKFWKGLLERGRFTIGEQYKKSTRRDYEEDGFKKVEIIPYDENQLLWGNVNEDWGNGIRQTKTEWAQTNKPIVAYATIDPDIEESIVWFKWQKCLQHIKECGWYEFADDDNFLKIPVPECFLPVVMKILSIKDKETKLIDYYREYEMGVNRDKSKNGLYAPKTHPEYGVDFNILVGLRAEHLQRKGKKPTMVRETNIGENCPEKYPDWHYDLHGGRGLVWHFDDCSREGMYDDIKSMADNEHLDDSKKDEYLHYWQTYPCHYVQKSEFSMEVEGTEKSMGDHTWTSYEIDGINIPESDHDSLKDYFDTWLGDEVKENWSKGLVSRNWFDDQGNQLFICEQKEVVKRWLYDKSWVFNRYKEASGLGYGHNTPDEGEFWKGIIQMCGGKKDDGQGGKFKNTFYKQSGHRIAYWEFIPLSIARDELSKFFGRKIKWEDEEDTGDSDEECAQEWY
jgi:hypothetical protein